MDLTIAQLNLLIEIIGDRQIKDKANSAIGMRLAVASVLSKEGAQVFQEYLDRVFKKPIIAVTAKDLAQFGLGRK